jgi:L-alanine-DL-glutamate epimerase-like enolase superfamily enzyme
MERRNFLRTTSIAGLSTIAFSRVLEAHELFSTSELSKHIIGKAEILKLKYHWPRFVGKNARRDDHGQNHESTVLKITTDQGASGWGLCNNNTDINRLTGQNLASLILPAKGVLPTFSKDFDFALFDLAGVILNKPVYKLIGNHGKFSTPLYSGMIYLDELNQGNTDKDIKIILDNCQWDYNFGYRYFKIKIGRSGKWYSHDEGLSKDIEIVKTIHQNFNDVKLLVDANDMYSLEDTKAFLKEVKDVPLFWMEEPFAENEEECRDLRIWMDNNGFAKTLYADGEYSPKHEQCMNLLRNKSIDLYLNDIFGYGFTNWMRLMPELEKIKATASPHAWGDKLKTNYTTHLAAGMGNIPIIEGVTCISEEIDYGNYPIHKGNIVVSDAPGFGMKILR